MAEPLTVLRIESLSYQDKTRIIWDTTTPNFGIRIGKRKKTYVTQIGKNRKLVTLGHHPTLTLKAARLKAIQQNSSEPTNPQITPEAAISRFAEHSKGRVKKDTLNQYLSYLNHMELTTLNLSYADIQDKLKKWDGKPWSQNYAYASLRNFLNWCLEHGMVDKHPLFRKKPPNKTKSRERVLSDDEMGRIWRATGDSTYGRILRLLVLTGQRRTEVRNLRPEDVQDGTVTFHTKGDRINVLPVTPLMSEELKHLPFEFNNWSDAKARFDADCGVDFRHHDLRRTLATKLAQIGGIQVIVIERILGHSYGGQVFQTYQRHTFLAEMREALLRYEDYIRTIVGAQTPV